MNIDRFTKMLLVCLTLLLLVDLARNFLATVPAVAQGERSEIGRYQVAAWGAYSGERVHHSGYFVLDTVTGKIVDKGHETHSIGGAVPPR